MRTSAKLVMLFDTYVQNIYRRMPTLAQFTSGTLAQPFSHTTAKYRHFSDKHSVFAACTSFKYYAYPKIKLYYRGMAEPSSETLGKFLTPNLLCHQAV